MTEILNYKDVGIYMAVEIEYGLKPKQKMNWMGRFRLTKYQDIESGGR